MGRGGRTTENRSLLYSLCDLRASGNQFYNVLKFWGFIFFFSNFKGSVTANLYYWNCHLFLVSTNSPAVINHKCKSITTKWPGRSYSKLNKSNCSFFIQSNVLLWTVPLAVFVSPLISYIHRHHLNTQFLEYTYGIPTANEIRRWPITVLIYVYYINKASLLQVACKLTSCALERHRSRQQSRGAGSEGFVRSRRPNIT